MFVHDSFFRVLVHPIPALPFACKGGSAVRYKFAFVSGIQVAVYRLKYAYFEGYTNVCQLVCISQERGRYLA